MIIPRFKTFSQSEQREFGKYKAANKVAKNLYEAGLGLKEAKGGVSGKWKELSPREVADELKRLGRRALRETTSEGNLALHNTINTRGNLSDIGRNSVGVRIGNKHMGKNEIKKLTQGESNTIFGSFWKSSL